VLSQTIRLDGDVCTIVGVMPTGFFFPIPDTKIYRPFALDAMPDLAADRESHWILATGRLAEGATLEDAEAELKPLMAAWSKEHKHNIGHFIVLQPFREMLVGDERLVLLLVLAGAGLVLLIICANLANLLLARGEARRREVAVRVAFGAGRARLVRQLLTESLLLAGTGGLLALLIGPALLHALVAVDPDAMPPVGPISFDARVLAFTVALSIATGVLFGLVPAFQVSTMQLQDVLKNRALTATGRSTGVRRALVVLEVSLSLAIVVAAGCSCAAISKYRTCILVSNGRTYFRSR
jgi:putative ABC transport system permease protein